ncbi:MAG: acylase [Pontixanthobacter sp.]
MKRWLVGSGLGVVGLVALALIALMTWEPLFAERGRASADPAPRLYTAEIVRSEFGVPHIYGRTDADVAYGVAVAHAQDDFFTLQDVIAMARGRYGAIAGEEGAQVDFAYHLIDARGTAERHYGSLPGDTRALFEAYATGLNEYAAAHPGEIKLARLFPVNGEDVATGFALRQPFFFGLGNIIGDLVAGEGLRPEFGPAINGPEPLTNAPRMMEDTAQVGRTSALPLHMGIDGALAGSNAWAIAPDKSGDGVTRVVSNAHQPWHGGVAWYELVVESGEGWHFAGANFPGSPFPFLGHNEHLGWTNTVNRPDMTDVYRLELDDSGTQYRLDGEWRDLESETVTLPVRMGPVVLPIRRIIHRSVHGPVVVNDDGAFAIRYGGIDNLGQLDAYYRLNKATNFADWQRILARMDIPSTNFIYGDRAGNIAMIYNAAIPDRAEGPDWRSILPGDRSDLIWWDTVDFAAIPKIINPASGWVYNANNTPFSATGPADNIDPASLPARMGVELKETNRSRRTEQLMAQYDTIDRKTLESIKYDTGYLRKGYVADMLDSVAALDLDDRRLRQAQRLLASWDLTADSIGAGDAIALLMIRPWMSAEYQNQKTPDAREELVKAAEHLVTHFGTLTPPMSDLLRLRQGPGRAGQPLAVDLPLDGGSDTLRASTLWDVDDDGRLSVRHGDSFIMFMEWEPGRRVRSQSIQPFGSATTRPGSVHFADQSALFVRHELKPVHFWRDEVMTNARSRQIVSNR